MNPLYWILIKCNHHLQTVLKTNLQSIFVKEIGFKILIIKNEG